MRVVGVLLLTVSGVSALTAPAPRVVVTGVGVVSSIGSTKDSFWESLLKGETGIGKLEAIEGIEAYPCQIGAEVKDFEPKQWFKSPKSVRSNDRYTHFAVAASKMAMEDAGLDDFDPERCGCIIGSAFGGIATIEREMARMEARGPRKVSPFAIPSMLANTASGVVGIEMDLRALNYGVVSACASGTHAIGEALNAMRRGEADVVVAGGSEAAATPLMYAGFSAMKAMNTQCNDDPLKASRPFDADRAGFVMGEGAGVLVLETLEHARRRGATVYAELAGYGASCDAHHITTPHPEGRGLAACLHSTLKSAGLEPEDVAYVNAHGTSTPYNDKFETMALKQVFGDHATSHALKISSIKGSTAHTLGAAGGLEAVATVLAAHTGVLPPTINYETPDPECDLDYVPNEPFHLPDDAPIGFVSESLGFGGHNGAIAFKRFHDDDDHDSA